MEGIYDNFTRNSGKARTMLQRYFYRLVDVKSYRSNDVEEKTTIPHEVFAKLRHPVGS